MEKKTMYLQIGSNALEYIKMQTSSKDIARWATNINFIGKFDSQLQPDGLYISG